MSRKYFTRSELFELVWSHPLTTVAKTAGVSDVAVAKACRRHKIPLPPMGYWLRAGPRLQRPSLPGVDPTWEADVVGFAQPEPGRARPKVTLKDLSQFKVRTSFANAHPLIRSFRNVKFHQSHSSPLLEKPMGAQVLDVRVSPGSTQRALLVFDAVLRASEAAGAKWRVEGDYTYLSALGGTIRVNILEHATATFRPGTWGRERTLTATGNLSFRCGYDTARRPQLTDSPNARLEDKIPQIVTTLLEDCALEAQQALERLRDKEIAEQRRAEEEREQAVRIAATERTKRLLEAAESYDAAGKIRALCRALEAREENRELADWIIWARNEADLLDPSMAQGLLIEM